MYTVPSKKYKPIREGGAFRSNSIFFQVPTLESLPANGLSVEKSKKYFCKGWY